ncbi:hypothetical protein MTBBW1_1350006 [Desulfamplus magnetovallimortis]|uniref:Uncharacterized protein n=1 Tax=Desulfamplus magnetovallimortis TaxID=1246637 RepID=A0A1W1H7L4_9BACT|nr:hypothetical protein MTBBW1_1350006 [Desulfamplus magnetovallimortis]
MTIKKMNKVSIPSNRGSVSDYYRPIIAEHYDMSQSPLIGAVFLTQHQAGTHGLIDNVSQSPLIGAVFLTRNLKARTGFKEVGLNPL